MCPDSDHDRPTRRRATTGFPAREFTLYVLSQLRARDRVEDGLERLRATTSEMRTAADRVAASGVGSPTSSVATYERWLGHAAFVEDVPTADPSFAGSRRHRFRLAMWPHLDFAINEHPRGWVFDPGFVRALDSPSPAWAAASDLAVWTASLADVEAAFGPGTLVDGWENARDLVVSLRPGPLTLPVPHRLDFDYGLLQAITLVP